MVQFSVFISMGNIKNSYWILLLVGNVCVKQPWSDILRNENIKNYVTKIHQY